MSLFRKTLFAVFLAFSTVYIASPESFAGTVSASTASKDIVAQVDPKLVCMINNTVMGKPQIPVEVNGKTYYGCCEGCVGKLKNLKSARTSKDPITGKEVDKASAYIASYNGEALYFESAETARQFSAKSAK